MDGLEIDGRQNGLRYPNRKPWLLLAILVIAAIIGLQMFRGKLRRAAAKASAVAMAAKPTQVQPVRGVPDQLPVARPVAAPEATTRQLPQAVVPASNDVAKAVSRAPQLMAEAKALEEKDDLAGARGKWHDILRQAADARAILDAEEKIGKLNIALVLTPRPMPEKVDYVVQAGDSIEKIAKKHGTTVDLVQESNQLKNVDLIKAGDRLVVLTGKVSVVVSKGRNDLVVRLNDMFFKRYRVGTGKYNKTPTGTFVVADRQKEPVWWRPDGKEIPFGDKENILGTRWLSIKATGATLAIKGYGIHGTWDETTIGKSESAGCVRMKNSDVEELFKLVPVNTPVTITE